MTPHDLGIDALSHDPSMLGLEDVVKVEAEIPLYDPRLLPLTDIDVLYELGDGNVAIAELKASRGTRWLKAMRQLTIGSQYVQERYGVDPFCFYVHGVPGEFTILRSYGGVGTFEPVGVPRSGALVKQVNSQLEMFADRLPKVSLYGAH